MLQQGKCQLQFRIFLKKEGPSSQSRETKQRLFSAMQRTGKSTWQRIQEMGCLQLPVFFSVASVL
jgi:hypothetical protein